MNDTDERNSSNTLSLKTGWVKKKSTSKLPIWNKRYLVLNDFTLKYFHKEEDLKPAGILDFNILTVDATSKSNVFVLVILGSSRKFKFRCGTEQESRDWVYLISLRMQTSNGNKIISSISTKKKYWKEDRISPFQFEQEVDTGDLLLFQGKNALSKMQRTFTRGTYDHVALLIKYPSNKFCLFEVTGVDGVAVLLWDDFVFYQWQNLYSKLTYKKLTWDRPEEAINKLHEFVNRVKGMDYHLSASKLFSKKNDKDISKKKGFFCSELIAKAYKTMGLLPEGRPSSKYWPADFEDGKMILNDSARLENGLLIDFDLT
jgi:PH domain/Permuted papain-like amidase enzyme, YaeF/YiiX, C92 family